MMSVLLRTFNLTIGLCPHDFHGTPLQIPSHVKLGLQHVKLGVHSSLYYCPLMGDTFDLGITARGGPAHPYLLCY